jgi:hypothetical protein
LIGAGLLAGSDVRISVNRVGDAVQLVRIGPDHRAWAEYVPPDARDELLGWIRTAERAWGLRGLEWRFESVQESWSRWRREA